MRAACRAGKAPAAARGRRRLAAGGSRSHLGASRPGHPPALDPAGTYGQASGRRAPTLRIGLRIRPRGVDAPPARRRQLPADARPGAPEAHDVSGGPSGPRARGPRCALGPGGRPLGAVGPLGRDRQPAARGGGGGERSRARTARLPGRPAAPAPARLGELQRRHPGGGAGRVPGGGGARGGALRAPPGRGAARGAPGLAPPPDPADPLREAGPGRRLGAPAGGGPVRQAVARPGAGRPGERRGRGGRVGSR